MVTVINEKGRRQKVLTYLATPDYIDDSLKPYRWYKGLCPCRWQGTRPAAGVYRRIHLVG